MEEMDEEEQTALKVIKRDLKKRNYLYSAPSSMNGNMMDIPDTSYESIIGTSKSF